MTISKRNSDPNDILVKCSSKTCTKIKRKEKRKSLVLAHSGDDMCEPNAVTITMKQGDIYEEQQMHCQWYKQQIGFVRKNVIHHVTLLQ